MIDVEFGWRTGVIDVVVDRPPVSFDDHTRIEEIPLRKSEDLGSEGFLASVAPVAVEVDPMREELACISGTGRLGSKRERLDENARGRRRRGRGLGRCDHRWDLRTTRARRRYLGRYPKRGRPGRRGRRWQRRIISGGTGRVRRRGDEIRWNLGAALGSDEVRYRRIRTSCGDGAPSDVAGLPCWLARRRVRTRHVDRRTRGFRSFHRGRVRIVEISRPNPTCCRRQVLPGIVPACARFLGGTRRTERGGVVEARHPDSAHHHDGYRCHQPPPPLGSQTCQHPH